MNAGRIMIAPAQIAAGVLLATLAMIGIVIRIAARVASGVMSLGVAVGLFFVALFLVTHNHLVGKALVFVLILVVMKMLLAGLCASIDASLKLAAAPRDASFFDGGHVAQIQRRG